MQCERMRSLLPEYQLGGLGPRLRRSMERHLESCATCAEQLKALEATDDQLVATLREEAPPDLWSRIEARLEERQPKRSHRLRYAWAPVCAAALVAAVWFVWGRVGSNSSELAQQDLEVGYERQHALLGWNDPLADRVQLGLVGLEATEGDAR